MGKLCLRLFDSVHSDVEEVAVVLQPGERERQGIGREREEREREQDLGERKKVKKVCLG